MVIGLVFHPLVIHLLVDYGEFFLRLPWWWRRRRWGGSKLGLLREIRQWIGAVLRYWLIVSLRSGFAVLWLLCCVGYMCHHHLLLQYLCVLSGIDETRTLSPILGGSDVNTNRGSLCVRTVCVCTPSCMRLCCMLACLKSIMMTT